MSFQLKFLLNWFLENNRPPVQVVTTIEPLPSQVQSVPLDFNPALVDESTNATRTPLCWNCKQSGHRFKKCPQKRRLFYRKCGRDHVTVNNYPNCQQNGRQSPN
ncbi:unnamed protein product [Psylliodes chrysocephalus]|uniref:CCHC-type domain-containing protein n=1 Tax=Psylliodes chrysocephalus TaxID=3402493 RepID=A0A9P0GJK0_9CUCU|nr:unnamed protein product [Psylliodes chrysocephala]